MIGWIVRPTPAVKAGAEMAGNGVMRRLHWRRKTTAVGQSVVHLAIDYCNPKICYSISYSYRRSGLEITSCRLIWLAASAGLRDGAANYWQVQAWHWMNENDRRRSSSACGCGSYQAHRLRRPVLSAGRPAGGERRGRLELLPG